MVPENEAGIELKIRVQATSLSRHWTGDLTATERGFGNRACVAIKGRPSQSRQTNASRTKSTRATLPREFIDFMIYSSWGAV
jgi:hypothetical protein